MRTNEGDLTEAAPLLWLLSPGVIFAAVVALTAAPIQCQTQLKMDVTHQQSSTTFSVAARRPIYTTLKLVAEEYGWLVDFEETELRANEVQDIAPPDWKAVHPASRGVLVPMQQYLNLTIPVDHPFKEGIDKPGVLGIVVGAMSSSLPGWVARTETSKDNRIAIIKLHTDETKSIGDYMISLPKASMNGIDGLNFVASKCGQAAGKSFQIGAAPANILSVTYVSFVEGPTSCRTAIQNVLDPASYELAYSILHDPGSGSFFLNIEPVTLKSVDTAGNPVRRLIMRQSSVIFAH